MKKTKFESLSSRKTMQRAVRILRKNDRIMAKLIAEQGIISSSWGPSDPYEAIVESFIYQQIAGSAANAILKKFKAVYGGRLPKPREFLETPKRKVRSAGISPQKYSYMKDLCKRLVNKTLDLEALSNLPDEEVVTILDDVRGIGRWTAEMFLMFSLRRVDVFPLDDLGVQNAVKKAYRIKGKLTRNKMLELSGRWTPYRSIAALYLWRSQDVPTM